MVKKHLNRLQQVPNKTCRRRTCAHFPTPSESCRGRSRTLKPSYLICEPSSNRPSKKRASFAAGFLHRPQKQLSNRPLEFHPHTAPCHHHLCLHRLLQASQAPHQQLRPLKNNPIQTSSPKSVRISSSSTPKSTISIRLKLKADPNTGCGFPASSSSTFLETVERWTI